MTIGIVTLSFNQAEFLDEAIKSVTVDPPDTLEYVIVDPGSTDCSRQIIDSHKANLSDVILEKDSGPADGLNRGFERLKTAEIFGYLNSDDRFAPGALNCVCEHFRQNPQTDVLLGSIVIIDQKGTPKYRARRVEEISLAKIAAGTAYVWQQATFFRREVFLKTHGFNTSNTVTWDWELVADLLMSGANVSYTSRVLGDFRIHPESFTGSGGLLNGRRSQWLRIMNERHRHWLRVRETICASHGISPRAAGRAAQWIYKLNPIRHLRNIGVGATELSRRKALTGNKNQLKSENRAIYD